MKLPVTKADVKLAKKHIKQTIKLEKKKVSEHLRAARRTPNKQSRAYNMSHAQEHKKDIKARQKYDKKIGG